jgi:acyl carrier protein
MSSQVFPRVRQVAADLFSLSPDEVTPETSPETVEMWDSLQHLNLVVALEQEFGVQLEPEEIEQMKDIGSVTRLLDEKLRR